MKLSLLLSSGNPLAALSALMLSKQRRLQFIENYEFPRGLKTRFAKSHPLLDVSQQELVFSALRDYFYICHQGQKSMVSMPSQVVDDAWHEFILFTREYNDFCLQAFGRYLHHTPAEAMQSQTQAQHGIKKSWRIACKKEGIDPNQPDRLPLIFAIDGLLHIENGFTYSLDCLSTRRSDYCAVHIGCATCGGDSGGSDGGADCDGDVAGGESGGCGDGGCGGSSCGGGCGGD